MLPRPLPVGKGFDGRAEKETSRDEALDMLTRMLSGEGVEAVLADPKAVLAEPKDTATAEPPA